MISNEIRKHIGKFKLEASLYPKAGFPNQGFDAINWSGIEKAMNSLLLVSKLWAVKFAIKFFGTGNTMKVMGD